MTVDLEKELIGKRHWCDISVASWEFSYGFRRTLLWIEGVYTTLVVPFSVSDGCCTREIAVPWNDDCELVELVL